MVLQNRILRAICNAGFRTSADPIYQRLKLLKFDEVYRYMVGAYVLKMLNSDRPCVFQYRDQTNYVTRGSVLDLLKVPRVTSAQTSHSTRVYGPKIYNVILLSIRNSTSYQTFMLKYIHFLRPSSN